MGGHTLPPACVMCSNDITITVYLSEVQLLIGGCGNPELLTRYLARDRHDYYTSSFKDFGLQIILFSIKHQL